MVFRGRIVLSWAILLATLPLYAVHAHPTNLQCSDTIIEGSDIMGQAVEESGTGSVALAAAGADVACGETITADEDLTFSFSGMSTVSSGTHQYMIEAVASDGTGSSGIIGGSCSRQRSANDASKTFTAPPSGTVTIRVAWASG